MTVTSSYHSAKSDSRFQAFLAKVVGAEGSKPEGIWSRARHIDGPALRGVRAGNGVYRSPGDSAAAHMADQPECVQ